jgi:hypothetical protein
MNLPTIDSLHKNEPKRAAKHSPFHCWFDFVELSCVPQSNREFENSHPFRGTQTGRSLRLPKLLFRSLLSANIQLPTIDGGTRLREMAMAEKISPFCLIREPFLGSLLNLYTHFDETWLSFVKVLS